MIVEQLYTKCLSEAAYFIASEGEAVIIDPLRDVQPYIELADKHNVKIKYVFETHFHADFTSGHIDLAKKADCPIVYGPNANPNYEVYKAKDGEKFTIGKLTLEVIHTPGHTLESTCYLLHNEEGKPHCIFTGDTLFIGDVGRPDLMDGQATKEELAGLMYETLNNKIKPLPNDIIVYPAHGPGSSCGKALGAETFDTLGSQKKSNYALQDISKEEFIEQVTDGLGIAPRHFPINAKINREGYESYDKVMKRGYKALSANDVEKEIEKGALVIDTRHENNFVDGFVPGSIFIGLDGRYAEWFGKLVDFDEKVIVVADKGNEEESISRLTRVGYDGAIGYLEGGFETWQNASKPIDVIISVDANEFATDYKFNKEVAVLDVRNEPEYDSEQVEDAINAPLPVLESELDALDKSEDYHVHCLSGYRSVIACSILRKNGFISIKNIEGGIDAIKEERNVPIYTAKMA